MRLPRREEVTRVVTLGAVGHFLYQMFFVLGLARTQAGNASLMLALVPLFMLAFGGARQERRPAMWLGAVVSLAGVGLVSGTSLSLEGAEPLVGDLMLFCGAGLWAIYTMGSQPLIQRYGPLPPTAWSLWVGSVGLIIAGIPDLLSQDWSVVPAAAWGAVFYSSILSTGVAHLLWYHGVLVLGGPHTAIISNLAPLVALSAGALLLGEAVTLFSVIGAVMIIGGVLLVRSSPASGTK
jgi:drug/metabolite transporter (DMT)-like permease